MIGIILLNYNSSSKTEFCLKSIENQNYHEYKIYIADNNSSENDLKELINLINNYKFIDKIDFTRLPENMGFSRANNILIKKALENNCKYIYILNNDVEILPNTLEELLIAINNEPNTIITNKILFRNKKNKIWFAGGYFDKKSVDYKTIGYLENDNIEYSKIYETDWASGASSFYTNDTLNIIGLFDENFFFGQEEWDLSLRAKNNGYKIMYYGNIPVFHEVGGSTKFRASFKIFLNTFNKLLFAKKHLKNLDYYLFLFKYIIYCFTIKRLKLQVINKVNISYIKFYYIQFKAFAYFFKKYFINTDVLYRLDIYFDA
jgi:GT2 family glycosyltransferase